MSWQPTASLPALKQRALLYRYIRQFFSVHNVLEVDVPLLSTFATSDPYIDSIEAQVMGQPHYLQTSPEFFLKRLLVRYQCDIYSLGKAFRDGERGTRHQPEFTMLEWYRVGWDEQQLMEEVRQLIQPLFGELAYQALSYRELFLEHLLLDPHSASVNELRHCAQQKINIDFDSDSASPWCDLLFTHCIEPKLPKGLVGVYDYPIFQAALARIDHNAQGEAVAKRFEMYLNNIELANGYWELCDGNEQEQRFKNDQQYRQQENLKQRPYDQHLVDALQQGQLPSCAGVAVGVDRLLMAMMNASDIKAVVSFC